MDSKDERKLEEYLGEENDIKTQLTAAEKTKVGP